MYRPIGLRIGVDLLLILGGGQTFVESIFSDKILKCKKTFFTDRLEKILVSSKISDDLLLVIDHFFSFSQNLLCLGPYSFVFVVSVSVFFNIFQKFFSDY